MWYPSHLRLSTIFMIRMWLNINLASSTQDGHFIVSTISYDIASIPQYNTTTGMTTYAGLCFDIINHISTTRNLTYEVRAMTKADWGVELSGGNWSGMIGELQQGRADIAASYFDISMQRYKVVDYSNTFYENGMVLFLKEPKVNNIRCLQPFLANVWYIRVVSILSSALCFVISFYMLKYSGTSQWCYLIKQTAYSSFDILGVHLQQPLNNDIIYRGANQLFFVVGLFVGNFFLTALYNSNLKAIFSVPTKLSRIESLSDALSDPSSTFFLPSGTSLISLLRSSPHKQYQQVWNRVKTRGIDNSLYQINNNITTQLVKILDENASAIIWVPRNVAQHQILKIRGVYIARTPVYLTWVHMVIRKGFRYGDIFKQDVRRLVETGKLWKGESHTDLCVLDCNVFVTYQLISILRKHFLQNFHKILKEYFLGL